MAWESQGRSRAAVVSAKRDHQYGGGGTHWPEKHLSAGDGSVGCCTGILVQMFGPKGRIATAALGSSYLPHKKEWKERVGESR